MKTAIIYDVTKALNSIDNFANFLQNQDYKESLKNIIIADFQKNFLEGGRPPWEPLSAITIEMRRKGPHKGRGLDILRDTDRMFTSIHSVDRGIGFYITTNAEYDSIQQEGTDKIPARPFFVLSKEALKEINGLGKALEKEVIK